MKLILILLIFINNDILSINNPDYYRNPRILHFQNDSIFTPNEIQGWKCHSSFAKNFNDTIRFEFIIYQVHNELWEGFSKIGKISPEFRPNETRLIEFSRSRLNMQLAIEKTGECHLRILNINEINWPIDHLIVTAQVNYLK